MRPPSVAAAGIIKALRPRQWIKNVLVVGASLATVGGDHDFRDVFYKAGIALVVCCLAASSIF
uniref:Decaprenyl-phosphate phosphoribosyltransferase n=1 Tax=Mycobacterium riyadhense TaxID=486698 RepID=A0A653EVC4_9MYCO|nr:Decaprenyl-phosphate phosphoribosyltransferase [Mycobacterium riyadhense]